MRDADSCLVLFTRHIYFMLLTVEQKEKLEEQHSENIRQIEAKIC